MPKIGIFETLPHAASPGKTKKNWNKLQRLTGFEVLFPTQIIERIGKKLPQ